MEQMAHQVQTAFRGHRGLQALLGKMVQMEYQANQVQTVQLGLQDLQDYQVLYLML